ncbi:MAG TPA: lipid-binding SYLF domain-containing protein [Gammaproteobacteria bacterium]|nr:lipid-binding SYLF domain-containing protein [Gammaproteobacteria bacterium]
MGFGRGWVLLGWLATTPVLAATAEEDRVATATSVLEQLADIPEQYVPPSLLNSAYGIAVIPNVIKIGLGIGGRHGKGVLVVRDGNDGWSDPVFVSLTGGSFGWQIGAQSTDIILVFKTRRSVEGLTGGKLTLGADAAVAAGPVGRHAEAATDIQLKSEVYSYSRNRGLFAGVALEGTAITIDDDANAAFYGRPGITAAEIWAPDSPRAPAVARAFLETLASTTPRLETESAPPGGRAATPGSRDPQGQSYPEETVRTYPVESESRTVDDPDGDT